MNTKYVLSLKKTTAMSSSKWRFYLGLNVLKATKYQCLVLTDVIDKLRTEKETDLYENYDINSSKIDYNERVYSFPTHCTTELLIIE